LRSRSIVALAVLMVVTVVAGAALAKRTAPPASVVHRSTTSIEAYRWYLQGRRYMDRRTLSDLHAATAAFRQATEADSSYAPAYAWLANAYGMLGYFGAISPVE